MHESENLKNRLRKFYSETTVDHIIHPRNMHEIPTPDGYALIQSSHDESLKIWLKVRNDIVVESGFWTDGCAATIACGSMSTELVKDKTLREALAIEAVDIAQALVDLPEGNFHCAELANGALRLALQDCLSTRQQPWKKLYRK